MFLGPFPRDRDPSPSGRVGAIFHLQTLDFSEMGFLLRAINQDLDLWGAHRGCRGLRG